MGEKQNSLRRVRRRQWLTDAKNRDLYTILKQNIFCWLGALFLCVFSCVFAIILVYERDWEVESNDGFRDVFHTGRQGILHSDWNVWRKDVVLS